MGKELKPTLWVHGSIFHLDDALCAAMGSIMGYQVKRTLDNKIVENCGPADIIADFGRKYDGVKYFDHHQPDAPYAQAVGIESRFPFAQPAAAGYMWAAFHKTIVKIVDPAAPDNVIPEVRDTIDFQLIAPSDRIDQEGAEVPPEITSFSAAVGFMNPITNDEKEFERTFMNAVRFVQRVLEGAIKKCLFKIYSREAINAAPIVNGNILVLDKYMPWQATVCNNPKFNKILFCVYPSLRGGWNGQTVPRTVTDRKNRKDFPIEWAGVAGKALAQLAGQPWETENDGYFCHVSRFLIAAPTKEIAIKMCQIAAEQ
jgi:uncharacterized UPF0160 family protein